MFGKVVVFIQPAYFIHPHLPSLPVGDNLTALPSGGRLVIIEVKLHEDDNILFQALRYVSDIDKNRHLIATLFSNKPIATDQPPRILLIAERFSEDVRRLSTLVVPEVELLEYSAVRLPDGTRALCFHTVSPPIPPSLPATPSSIEKLIEYLKEDSLSNCP